MTEDRAGPKCSGEEPRTPEPPARSPDAVDSNVAVDSNDERCQYPPEPGGAGVPSGSGRRPREFGRSPPFTDRGDNALPWSLRFPLAAFPAKTLPEKL